MDIAVYYFPNYHHEPRNDAVHGANWTEWDLVRSARPRFAGHHQPRVPAWGYEDEADPAAMARKIDAAADHGITQFIFDWYWYDEAPFLERALTEGFLQAPNAERLGFALMWANHDWIDIHPGRLRRQPPVLFPGATSPEAFDRMTDRIIERFFTHPSYWKIDGKPYFSIYALQTLIDGLGGLDATRRAIVRFRDKVVAAGFPGLHLNAIVWGRSILPGEQEVRNINATLDAVAADSVGSYVWVHLVELPDFPTTDYGWLMRQAKAKWPAIANAHAPVYFPNVTVGWDASPRAHQDDMFERWQYPFSPVLAGDDPALFREALQAARDFLQGRPKSQQIVTLNAWNEWTEGSYLEPDRQHGTARLEAIREVFGNRAKS